MMKLPTKVFLKLDGDQYQPEFLELNPFHHVPVLIDDGFTLIESLAILDYLEAKYPTPPLMPSDPKAIATVRIVQMVTLNELWSPMIRLTGETMGFVKNVGFRSSTQPTISANSGFENMP